MRRDVVRPNILENSGGYLWQVAARLACVPIGNERPGRLVRPSPPTVTAPLSPWPLRIFSEANVRWSDDTKILRSNTTPILSQRGTTKTLAVNVRHQSFVEVSVDIGEELSKGCQSSILNEVVEYGNTVDWWNTAVALARHGLISFDRTIDVACRGLYLEPFARVDWEEGDGAVVTNLINGRFLRVNRVLGAYIAELDTPTQLTEPLRGPLLTLVQAGVLRIVGELK